ncbi:MAG: hypothetical protein M3Y71_15500 [Actinomycetota bacterium]|nr:hypothetical protein [Actinomycetota bacterium]
MSTSTRGRTRRSTPDFKRWLGTGALLGFFVGFVIAMVSDRAQNYSAGSQVGYLGVMLAFLGALLAGLVAVLVDRRH